MRPELIFACIAIIAVGVAIIMYTLLRPAKTATHIGRVSSIDLGEETPNEKEEETTDNETETETKAETENTAVQE